MFLWLSFARGVLGWASRNPQDQDLGWMARLGRKAADDLFSNQMSGEPDVAAGGGSPRGSCCHRFYFRKHGTSQGCRVHA